MSDLIKKVFTIKEDVKGMEISSQLKYILKLYHDIQNQTQDLSSETSQLFSDAMINLESMWQATVYDYERIMIESLEKRVKEITYCKIEESSRKNNSQHVIVEISDQFKAEISYNWDSKIRINFFQNLNNGTMIEVIIRWKIVPEWLKESTNYVRGHFEKDVSLENWVDVILETVMELKQRDKEVASICHISSNVDSNGAVIKTHKSWKTNGRIVSLEKGLPAFQRVFHASREGQSQFDRSYFFHGSNGTYVENVNSYWSLKIKIKRPSYEVPHPIDIEIDIHEYITKSLMQRLEWGKITQNRLELLNNILSGIEMRLITMDTDKAALYREFIPVGFDNWNEYLDSVILPKINV